MNNELFNFEIYRLMNKFALLVNQTGNFSFEHVKMKMKKKQKFQILWAVCQ